MANPIDNVMQGVYAYLLAAYQSSTGSSSALLAFEPSGIPISNAMFVLPGTSTVSNDMGTEQVSELANFLPNIANGMVGSTDRSVDGFYGLMLDAQPSPGTDPDSFAIVKATAKQLFEPTLNTFELPNYPYHPIFANPVDWYDETNTQNWTTYSSGQTTGTAGDGTSGTPPASTPPPPIIAPISWHVLMPVSDAIVVQDRYFSASSEAIARPLLRPDFMIAHPMERALTPAAALPQMATASSAFIPNRFSMSQFALALHLQTASTAAQPVVSAAPSVSFEYCLVTLQRRWLSEAFLGSPGWYLNGYLSGSLSTGATPEPSAAFDAVPTAFIVIQNLKIHAQWSQADTQAMQSSSGIGPFSLASQSFDAASGTLSCGGMQIIGWVCERQPLLPPQSDPSLVPVTSTGVPAATTATSVAASSSSSTATASSSTSASVASTGTAVAPPANTSA